MRPRMTSALLLMAAVIWSGAGSGAARAADDGAETRTAEGGPAAAAPATFETLARSASPTGDLAALLGPLVDPCPDAGRDLDRARCRAAQTYLRRTLPERSLSLLADDRAAISVSAYDPALKGYRVALAGCIACTSPILIGRSAQPFLVTVKKPVETAAASDRPRDKSAQKNAEKSADKSTSRPGDTDKGGLSGDSPAEAAEIASTNLTFASEADATRWLRQVRPRLRATFIFKPTPTEWRSRASRGYDLALVAARIADPCTGAIVLSSPPSVEQGPRTGADGCASVAHGAPEPKSESTSTSAQKGGDSEDDDEEKPLPLELSRSAIAEAMGQIRSQVFACFQLHKVPGTAPLTYEVAGNGQIQSVRLDGALNGSPTGACILDAARGARFPRFDGAIQTFTYPFFLRR